MNEPIKVTPSLHLGGYIQAPIYVPPPKFGGPSDGPVYLDNMYTEVQMAPHLAMLLASLALTLGLDDEPARGKFFKEASFVLSANGYSSPEYMYGMLVKLAYRIIQESKDG